MEFNLVYDGKALETHEMDVGDLSIAMLAIDGLLSAANETLNGDRVDIKVKVKASFKTGSFGIDLVLVQSFIDTAKGLFGSGTGIIEKESITKLLFSSEIQAITIVGGAIGASVGTAKGLIALLKWLKGVRPTQIIDTRDGFFSVYKDGKYITAEKKIIDLYRTYKLRKAFESIVSPTYKDGIDSVAFISKNKKMISTIKDKENIYFKCPEVSKEKQSEVQYQIDVIVISPDFKEDRKWYIDDGQSSYYVSIEDDEFISRIDAREEVFGKGDILTVMMRKEQFYSKDEKKLKAEHFIEKVIGRTTPAGQEKLIIPK